MSLEMYSVLGMPALWVNQHYVRAIRLASLVGSRDPYPQPTLETTHLVYVPNTKRNTCRGEYNEVC